MLILLKYRFFSQHVYFWLLTLLSVTLPFSAVLTSVCVFLLLINWLLEGNWESRFYKLKNHKSLFVFLAIFFLYIIWLPFNENHMLGLKDLVMKLPLLFIPVILVTSESLDASKIRLLLRFFIGSVVFSSLISIAVYYNLTGYKVSDVREISIFIPHVHFSMLIIIAILTILHWIKSEGRMIGKHHMLYVIIIVWLIFFLFLLKSLTGVVVLGLTMFVLILILLNTIENQFLKVWLIIVMYAIPFFSVVTLLNAYNTFYEEKDNLSSLESHTQNGMPYYHDSLSRHIENGYRVMIYLCEPELEQQWGKRSQMDINGQDYKGQNLKHTLIRYMTSKGLRKDSAGIWQLTNTDIRNIENGMTNFIFQNNWSLYPRIYETIWEIHNYRITGSTSESSFIQRFEYLAVAFDFIKEKFWFGTGNADVSLLFEKYYSNHSRSADYTQDYVHNQYLRTMMAFGLVGFLIFVAAFLLPPFMERRWPSYYFLMTFLIFFLYFFNEDVLETGVGVNMMAFFYSLFLWGSQRRLL